ncbi:MAG TPA: hypothetical protein VMI10_07750 [Terriglobales bacterium]|nr:hypothetical protein [Terriglobales bacterium]
MRVGRIVIAMALLMLPAASALGQGCAMCYSTAQAASKDGQRAIARGIVILAIPPIGVVTLGLGLAFRYGKKRDQDNASQASDAQPKPLER